jgi:hypothetical protein
MLKGKQKVIIINTLYLYHLISIHKHRNGINVVLGYEYKIYCVLLTNKEEIFFAAHVKLNSEIHR